MILPATIDSVLTQKIPAIYNSKSNKRFQLHHRYEKKNSMTSKNTWMLTNPPDIKSEAIWEYVDTNSGQI